ncbi:MAG: DUF2079 domain-containing protein [Candidatus Margulisiibacteriota bacterium]
MTDRPPTFAETIENYRGLLRSFINWLKSLGQPRYAWFIVLAAVGYYIFTFSAYSILLHQTFQTQAFDAGIEDQGAWLLSQFSAPLVTVRGLNIFGDSITLYHFLAALALRLFRSINSLFILQALIIALGAVPLFFFARKELKHDWLAATVALAYLLYPALQNMNLEQYHPEAFTVTAMVLTLFFLQEKNYRYYYLWLALALIAKDEVSLTGIFLGLYLVLFKKEYVHGWWTAGLSLAWYLLCSRLFLPFFNEVGIFAAQPLTYSHWFRGLMANLFNPQFYLRQIFSPDSLAYYFGLLAPLAFIPLLGPAYMFLALPSLGLNVLSGTGYIRSIYYHYNYIQTAILFFALVDGLKFLRRRFFAADKAVKFLGWIVFVFALAGNLAFSHFPLPRQLPLLLERANNYCSKANQAKLDALKLIPADAKVSASFAFVPHLSHRREIYLFPNPFRPMLWGQWFQEGKGLPPALGHVDYLVIDQPNLSAEDGEILAYLVGSGRFAPLYDRSQTMVLKRVPRQEQGRTGVTYRLTGPPNGRQGKIAMLYFPESNYYFRNVLGEEVTRERPCSVEFTGFLLLPASGRYSFLVASPSRCELTVQGKKIAGPAILAAGIYPFLLKYDNNGEPFGLKFIVLPPHGKKYIVTDGDLPAGNGPAIFRERLRQLALASGQGQPELVKNPGFEQALVNKPAGWLVECWQDDKAQCEYLLRPGARSGRNCAMVRHDGTADSRWVQEVKVEPDTTYRLAGWVKTAGVGPAGTGAFLQIAGTSLRTRILRGDNDWTLLEVTSRTPPNAERVKIECRLGDFGATTKGTAYFDEISLKKVPAWPK